MIELNGVKMYFADLHIHSRFSRACSSSINIENLEKWARIKGLDILGTSDFTHPEWLKELRENLEEREGILYTKSGFKFVLSSEISLIYTQEHGRRVHLVMLAPSFEVVDKINSWLDTQGRRDYDGRPIFKISCEDFVKKMLEISEEIEVFPAHVWTPWFGMFGSMSGFDSMKGCFGKQVNNVHAIETGMSSNPEMNLRLDELQEKTIMSYSDAHSFWPWRIGREATIFPSINSYKEIVSAIRENKVLGVVEVNPAYGKYHFDGHRSCGFSCPPEKFKELKGVCPECGKQLLKGVEHRVEDLADFDVGKSQGKMVFEMLPLHELISSAVGSGLNTKRVWAVYDLLIEKFGNEFNILLKVEKEKLLRFADEKLVWLIMMNRENKVRVKPGYDGIYGKMIVDEPREKQGRLF